MSILYIIVTYILILLYLFLFRYDVPVFRHSISVPCGTVVFYSRTLGDLDTVNDTNLTLLLPTLSDSRPKFRV